MTGGFQQIAEVLKRYLAGEIQGTEVGELDVVTLLNRLEAITPGGVYSASIDQIAEKLKVLATEDREIRQMMVQKGQPHRYQSGYHQPFLKVGGDFNVGGDFVQGTKITNQPSYRESIRTAPETTHVFLSYATEDRTSVLRLANLIKASGMNVWVDHADLRGGQDWEGVITQQLAICDVVVACLSTRFIQKFNKRDSFLRKEIEISRSRMPTRPECIFMVPFCLEPCSVPQEMAHLHAITCEDEPKYDRLLEALRDRVSTGGSNSLR